MWLPVGTAAVHDAQAAVAQPDHSGSRTVHSWDCTRWAGIQSISYRAFVALVVDCQPVEPTSNGYLVSIVEAVVAAVTLVAAPHSTIAVTVRMRLVAVELAIAVVAGRFDSNDAAARAEEAIYSNVVDRATFGLVVVVESAVEVESSTARTCSDPVDPAAAAVVIVAVIRPTMHYHYCLRSMASLPAVLATDDVDLIEPD